MAFPCMLTWLFLIEVNNMDLYWSGLAQQASENTWNERSNQFSKVHEMDLQDILEEGKK